MDLWRSLTGMVEVSLTSADPEAALAALNSRGIAVYHGTRSDELTLRFRVARRDLPALTALCAKRGEALTILERRGLYWQCMALLRRRVLLAGMGLLLALSLFLPTRVLFVQVEGNQTVPTRLILESARESGISFGASRRQVRSERVKNALLEAVPQLQWAGVNTAGCVATISVRERAPETQEQEEYRVSSIVAARDGFILSATVTRGSALVQPGQAVREGQVLISGYTDCGRTIQATQAEGEVTAQTSRELEAVTPAQWTVRGKRSSVRRKFSLLLGKKRINFWKDSGILEVTCGRMYEEYHLTLPGGFRLPIALCVERWECWETATRERPEDQARQDLSAFAQAYLSRRMIAGTIRERDEDVALENGVYRLRGSYTCVEMIGRVRTEQIGESNGKDR